MIRQASHAGLAEAEFVVPQFAADAVKDQMRDAAVRVSVDGSGETHFAGYLAVDSGNTTPTDDGVVFRGYSITRWLERYHVGQFTEQWEVTYPIVDKVTGLLTGWTPALILQHLFAQLPDKVASRLKLGDISVLHDLSSVGTPDITFRLTDYASAINQLIGLVGDVAFRERFQGAVTFLDFYRINAPSRDKVTVRHASWDMNSGRPNVQTNQGTTDSTNVVDRVLGHGAYRQFMVTCRNYIAGLDAIGEVDPFCRLIPMWDASLEPLVLASPEVSKGQYTAMTLEAVEAGTLAFNVSVALDKLAVALPVGATMTNKAGNLMRVVGFVPKVEETPATVTVEWVANGIDLAAMEENELLQVRVPELEHVFRRYRLPAALNNCTIMRHGCLEGSNGEPYPQYQAFVYESQKIEHADDGEGNKWVEGVLPTDILQTVPQQTRVGLDVEGRVVTFRHPTLAFLEKKPARNDDGDIMQDDNGVVLYETKYRRTVCGITLTVENQAYAFGYDTGARPVTRFDFNEIGFSERFQKNDFQFWQLGTGGMPINGVSFPCIYFSLVSENSAQYVPAGSALVARNDIMPLRSLCEQILRERNRRARAWNIVIPWFAPGYNVGQEIEVKGLRNFPKDTYKITSVEHSMSIEGVCSTMLQIDNIKPPVRHSVSAMR